MIRTVNGEHIATCEDCGTEEYSGTLEFREFIQFLVDDGWRIIKDREDWGHYCPDCTE